MNRAAAWYATNARNLLEMRKQGFTPEGPVVVSLVGGDFDDVADTALYVRPDMPLERMDWRMLVNLTVWLWAGPTVPLAFLQRVTKDIAAVRPAQLIVRFEAADAIHDIEVGASTHFAGVLDVPAVHQFSWAPINLTGSAVGAQLRRAFVAAAPQGGRL